MSRLPFVLVACGIALGLASGVGAFTFWYARGASYLGHDAAACANCHVMRTHYDAWLKSPHRSVATCNDCHAPGALVPKYATKALNGFRHSFAFTSGRFREPIQATSFNRAITEQRCRDCHGAVTAAIDPRGARGRQSIQCTRCHATVGHS
jgi:cytochrome c nitrite reductase small subunit